MNQESCHHESEGYEANPPRSGLTRTVDLLEDLARRIEADIQTRIDEAAPWLIGLALTSYLATLKDALVQLKDEGPAPIVGSV